MSTDSIDVRTLTTALLSVLRTQVVRPDLPGVRLFTCSTDLPSDTDSIEQSPPLERQIVRLNGRVRPRAYSRPVVADHLGQVS